MKKPTITHWLDGTRGETVGDTAARAESWRSLTP